ncbi:hypothetical protein [Gilvimarinus sp. DA14]|uniref:hypothetical protein n=1 Tax=Gilvimarinus sp. DA14 TaxID=2956798 RepID=UPI0020B8581B|nr:hypothetical protein [Gilvimarinus sp. DA14]UTF61740.1 hypothetical protein NHM04_08100 [Gilvimarinus sp. DA14]
MNERQRHQYLSALGIDSFVPRVVLPYAPEPVLCELPLAAQDLPPAAEAAPPHNEATRLPTANTDAPTSHERTPSKVGNVLDDMGITQSSKPVRKEPLQVNLPKAQTGVAPVHLHLWRPSPKLLIIDEHTPGSALPTETLLSNILRLCREQNTPLSNPERMRCPLNEQLAKMYSEDDLREELQAWLGEELAKQQEPELWLMGGDAAQWFVSPHTKVDTFAKATLNLTGTQQLPALVLPSLSELLQKPQLKRQLWNALHAV